MSGTGRAVLNDASFRAAIPATAAQLDQASAIDAKATAAKQTADAALPSSEQKFVASRAAAMAMMIAASVGSITTQAYAVKGDLGGATYVRVSSEPAHPGKFQSADGAWWEFANRESKPSQFGAVGDGVTDDTAALRAWEAHFNYFASAFGAQFPGARQPILRVPRRQCYVPPPGIELNFSATGTQITGTGRGCRLTNVQINMGGNNGGIEGITLDGPGGMGLRLMPVQRGGALVSRVYIRDKTTAGIQCESTGAYDQFSMCFIEKCNTNLVIKDTAGTHFVNCEFLSPGVDNIRIEGGGEHKMVQCRGLNAPRYNVCFKGSNRKNPVEMYFVGCTWTVAQRTRTMPILSVADNGSGFCRFTTSALSAITAYEDRGYRFIGGDATRRAETYFGVGSGTSGSVTAVSADGVSLISGPVAWTGDRVTTAQALVAAINLNAASTGYSAAIAGAKVYVLAPAADGAAANWRQLTVTSSGDIVVFGGRSAVMKLAAAADFSVGEDVLIQGSTLSTNDGTVRINYVESATAYGFVCEETFAGTDTGTVCRPNRQTNQIGDLRITGTGNYDATTVNITACTHNTFDTDVPYAGALTTPGSATLPSWDFFADHDWFGGTTNDLFFEGGNLNWVNVGCGFNFNFIGTRLKSQKWVEPQRLAQFQANRILHVGPGRGRSSDVFSNVSWSGAVKGWAELVTDSDRNTASPNDGYLVMRTPHRTAGLVNGMASAVNEVRVDELGVGMRIGGVLSKSVANQFNMFTHAMRQSTDHVNGWDINGSAANARLYLGARGTDTNVTVCLSAKGTGSVDLWGGGSTVRLMQALYVASAVNYAQVSPSIAGAGPLIGVNGTDTTAPLRLSGKGAPVSFVTPAQMPSYTIATLPTASLYPRSNAWCSNKANGAGPVYSDGANWIDPRTNAAAA